MNWPIVFYKHSNCCPKVEISDEILLINAKLSIALEVDGHRADLIMMKAEKSHGYFEGRSYVTIEDVKR